MTRKLGINIIIAFIVVLSGVITVGSASILMVKDILQNIDYIEEESRHVDIIDNIHNKIQNLIFSVHHFIIEPDESYSKTAINMIGDIEKEIEKYIKIEEAEGYKESRDELKILNTIKDNIKGIKDIADVSSTSSFDKNKLIDLERLKRFGYNIEFSINRINMIHFDVIAKRVNDSHQKMSLIFVIFIVFSSLGVLAVFGGYRILTLKITKPVKQLASATQRLAGGDLSIRVSTDSKTEIGTLYNSFNTMAERLQEHKKKLVDFNRELEEKVKERTLELEEVNESLRRAQADLIRMEKIATLGQIATSVNHEIKTPLNSLYMNLQLLTRRVNTVPEQCGTLKKDILNITSIIDNEIIRINEILEEFVRYARFSPPELKKDDLNKIVKDVVDMITQKAQESRVEIKLSLSDDIPLLMIDEKKMNQALLNLCINAIQAMPYGGKLTIETLKDEDTVILNLYDTGIGIPEKDIEKVFTPFFTKKEEGLGFGLSIVQRIIEDHKGQIRCKSKVAEGTVFRISLPAYS